MSITDPAMATAPTLGTLMGTTIKFLPVPTAWPSQPGCETNIYRQSDDGPILAWDPIYAYSFVPSASSCYPSQFTSWWNQPHNQPTSTALGPTFVCPEQYYPVQTVIVTASTQQIYCCPSNYGLNVIQPPPLTFPSQCTSLVQPGQTLSYLTVGTDGNAAPTTTVVRGQSAATVWGVPVDGYNVVQSTTSGSSSTASQTPSNSTTPHSSPSSPTPVGVIVGAAIGCVLFLVLVVIGLFMFWKREKRLMTGRDNAAKQIAEFGPKYPGSEPYDGAPGSELSGQALHELPHKRQAHEMPSQYDVYELPTSETMPPLTGTAPARGGV